MRMWTNLDSLAALEGGKFHQARRASMYDRNDYHPMEPTCGLYLLGALDTAAELAFERHLLHCAVCQDECDRLGPVLTGMGRLGPADVRRLLESSRLPTHRPAER